MIRSDGSIVSKRKRSTIGFLIALIVVLGSITLYLSDFSGLQDPSISAMANKITSWGLSF